MNKKEFLKFGGQDLSELKICSALNADTYKKMDKDALSEFVIRDVNERAKKLIHRRWEEEVSVRCHYVVIDFKLNIVDSFYCELKYSHEAGTTLERIVHSSET